MAISNSTQPLILTFKVDAVSAERLNALRQAHFPPQRNHLRAHITLFHALPAELDTFVRKVLEEVSQGTPVLPVQFPKARFLGKGVAIEVECPELVKLRRDLTARFSDFLTAQDRQTIRPHVTIQNKVSPEVARQLFEEISGNWQSWNGSGEGLSLWRYLGGPWELIRDFEFQK